MIYTYRYRDGGQEYFELVESIKDKPSIVHNGRPCFRVIETGNFIKKGTGWPGEEAKGAYTRIRVNEDNTVNVLK